MYVSLWGFLSISVIAGIIFIMFIVYLNHKKTMRQMEIEVLKRNTENQNANVEKP